MSFEYHNPNNVQFGVYRGDLSSGDCVIVPVDESVKNLLHQMVLDTRDRVGGVNGDLAPTFDPAELYSGEARVRLSLDSPIAATIREFFLRENIPLDPAALENPQEISGYFCIIHDSQQAKLVAMKRASQFKAVLKAHLMRWADDSLQAVSDNVFKLDSEFDFLVADNSIDVLRVAGLEAIGEIDEGVQGAAVQTLTALSTTLPAISFEGLADYVKGHKRAARLVAALGARPDLGLTSITKLQRVCTAAGVNVTTINNKLCATAGHEMGLLQVLDRRRYSTSLISRRTEQYEASSRKVVGVRNRDSRGQPASAVGATTSHAAG